MSNICSELSKVLYDLFVVNPYAIAVQQEDGKYITKYIPYDHTLIQAMLDRQGALGCYQQGFKNGLIKWICLDFDCKDKENPQVDLLYSIISNQLLNVLDELEINYLTEFSGRRGIHVWILFSEVFSKKIGYDIVHKLSGMVKLEQKMFGVDLFPAVDSSKNNKVGKQVKIPLSCHKNGGRSFVFIGKPDFECMYQPQFYEQQYAILNDYKLNSIDSVCRKLNIDLSKDVIHPSKYRKIQLFGKLQYSVYDIEQILSEVLVFKNIFARLCNGIPLQKDWFVLLGTLAPIDSTGNLLKAIFATSPAYDEKITGKNILIWKSKYYPATFSYLYQIYQLEPEESIDISETGTEYLIRRVNEKYNTALKIMNVVESKNEKECLFDIKTTAEKEKWYLLINDENLVVSVWNALNNLTEYDFDTLQNVVNMVLDGKLKSWINKEYYKFVRLENEEKQRNMIVLGAYDRIITTHLCLILAYNNSKISNSFSYNVAFLSKNDIFYNWYTSWGNYIDKIKSFLEIPYLDDWGVIVVDIKGFYDNINFLAVYNLMKSDLKESDRNIFEFLIRYNEELMRKISGERIGVPQGPAYARIISEMFLDKILDQLYSIENSSTFILYRYVDDIIVFYDPSVDGLKLYDSICNLLMRNGLNVNLKKSKLYGPISKITDKDRRDILRKDKFNYMLQKSDLNMLMSENEKCEIYADCISDEFKIEDVAFIFSDRTNEFYTYLYFHKFKREIFMSEYGRGSIFMRFYKYIFSRRRFMAEALDDNCFANIPVDSLNFKNCISSLYYMLQKEEVDLDLYKSICDNFLYEIADNDLDEEERVTINTLLRWRHENE